MRSQIFIALIVMFFGSIPAYAGWDAWWGEQLAQEPQNLQTATLHISGCTNNNFMRLLCAERMTYFMARYGLQESQLASIVESGASYDCHDYFKLKDGTMIFGDQLDYQNCDR